MDQLGEALAACAQETAFHGAYALTRPGEARIAAAYGRMNDAGAPITIDTRFAIASGTKTFTALTVLRLVESGAITLATPARTILGRDLPLVDDSVTLEQLLAHRSGIGDYFDEDAIGVDDFVLPVPGDTLDHQEAWIAVLDGKPMVARPGETFRYNNSAFVILGLIAERVSGTPFHDLVHSSICAPAGLSHTRFHRNDARDPDFAIGTFADGRPNTTVMSMLGAGDGGLSSTLGDLEQFWIALFDGAIVASATREEMTRSRSVVADQGARYGLGCWLAPAPSPAVIMEGCDAGISAWSRHDPTTGVTASVLSNTTDGAWPLVRLIESALE